MDLRRWRARGDQARLNPVDRERNGNRCSPDIHRRARSEAGPAAAILPILPAGSDRTWWTSVARSQGQQLLHDAADLAARASWSAWTSTAIATIGSAAARGGARSGAGWCSAARPIRPGADRLGGVAAQADREAAERAAATRGALGEGALAQPDRHAGAYLPPGAIERGGGGRPRPATTRPGARSSSDLGPPIPSTTRPAPARSPAAPYDSRGGALRLRGAALARVASSVRPRPTAASARPRAMKKSDQGRGSGRVNASSASAYRSASSHSPRSSMAVDGVGVEAQLVVGDAAPSDDLLALRESPAALVGIGDGPGEPAENVRAVEPIPVSRLMAKASSIRSMASWRRPSASAALPRWSRQLSGIDVPRAGARARASSAWSCKRSKAPSIEEAKIAARRALSSAR